MLSPFLFLVLAACSLFFPEEWSGIEFKSEVHGQENVFLTKANQPEAVASAPPKSSLAPDFRLKEVIVDSIGGLTTEDAVRVLTEGGFHCNGRKCVFGGLSMNTYLGYRQYHSHISVVVLRDSQALVREEIVVVWGSGAFRGDE